LGIDDLDEEDKTAAGCSSPATPRPSLGFQCQPRLLSLRVDIAFFLFAGLARKKSPGIVGAFCFETIFCVAITPLW